MRWKKLGLVYTPDGSLPWARTHASLPTPYIQGDGTIRVVFTGYDEKGRGRPGCVDLDPTDPRRILRSVRDPLLDIGVPGAFDDNGVAATCVVRAVGGELFMYYAGFELCTHVRYRIFTGLAISRDDGLTYERYSRAPILDRSDEELHFRCGPFVLREADRFRLWYIAGSSWTRVGDKDLPVYDLRTLESEDGIRWATKGRLSMSLENEDEHGFGRPWVVKRGEGDYRLFYSIRRRSLGAYRLGYAESHDGYGWNREDARMALDVSPGGFDSQAIMYSTIVETGGRTYCFYNGDNFGERGFGVAELMEP